MRVDQAWELSLKTWEDIIEGQRVSGQVHPARVGCEDCQSLSGPETVRLAPGGDIWVELAHVGSESTHVNLPRRSAALHIEVLLEDAGPLAT